MRSPLLAGGMAALSLALLGGASLAVLAAAAPGPALNAAPANGPAASLKGLCLAAAKTETRPFAVEPARAADPLWFLRDGLGSPPLYDGLGAHGYRITTAVPEAQLYFDQGLRLAYGFNHAEAARAFREAQRRDPSCAMCFWGEAYVLGPNINAPMMPEAAAPAFAAAQKALALAGGARPEERALIEAVAQRYAPDAPADRSALDRAYAEAMADAAQRFPDDAEIGVLYAEALMDLQPWDYWQPGGREPKGGIGAAVATVERILAQQPDHPGAIHFYIHLVEASDRPQRAEPHADRLRTLVASAGHLVHMPSHIYYRIGRFADALEANSRAVAADEAYLAQVPAQGIYPGAYYPHNIHFLMTSAQMGGDGATAVAAAEKLGRALDDAIVRAVPWTQPIKQAPYFAHAQYSDPDAVLALPDPGDEFPFVRAAWHYARGVALAAKGDAAAARAEGAAIARIGQAPEMMRLEQLGVPAGTVLGIARLVLDGRIALAGGDPARARQDFAQAVALQDGIAYMEPPFWYYPVRQSLGAALLQAGDAEGAEQAFRAALQQSPNNSWVLFGLREALAAKGDRAGAGEADRRLQQAWIGTRGPLDLKRL